MRVAFLYNRSSEDPANAAEDEFPAQSPVVGALQRLQHDVITLECTLDLQQIRQRLLQIEPDVVFNRVESLGGSDSMMAAITLLLDSMQLPYTGNSTEALVGTASKLSVKERLIHASLPTPRWVDQRRAGRQINFEGEPGSSNTKYIIKPDREHASFAIDDAAIVNVADDTELIELISERELATGRPYFAEEFIEGREFNISILGYPPAVLPPAEIDFATFPHGKPRIVSRDAKWNAASFEYHNTPRRFDFPHSDATLILRLKELTLECWGLFRLAGYARVDFRIDALGHPWILEINTNPCIAPDAGFAAAMEYAGIGYDAGLQQILNCALVSHAHNRHKSSNVLKPAATSAHSHLPRNRPVHV